ncbi:hypothetical protein M775_07195 [Neisseria gonorrhoeae MU_NG6]|nr:hypothetical protein M771_09415 [Neisseria gonorrhoeae MU_NG1]KLS84876.1 hypothetical protein M773_04905 [Neisseria gonorrhoeae MU_NG4]KLS88191.1 hypothetical protein M775_07195 [Neisseria gonorrhoeae MU_NG6]
MSAPTRPCVPTENITHATGSQNGGNPKNSTAASWDGLAANWTTIPRSRMLCGCAPVLSRHAVTRLKNIIVMMLSANTHAYRCGVTW